MTVPKVEDKEHLYQSAAGQASAANAAAAATAASERTTASGGTTEAALEGDTEAENGKAGGEAQASVVSLGSDNQHNHHHHHHHHNNTDNCSSSSTNHGTADGGGTASDVIESLEQQKELIATLLKQPLVKGDRWYLLEHRWFKQWKKYVGFDTWETGSVGQPTANPGRIDNSALLRNVEDPENLRDHLIDELDYALMPEEAWNKLVEWYGIMPNQSPIARTVVDYGMFLKNLKVEIYKMELKLCLYPDTEDCKSYHFSKVATLEEVEKVARSLFNIPEEANTRLWYRFSTCIWELIENKSRTIQEESIYTTQIIQLVVQNPDGTWPRCNDNSSAATSASLVATTTKASNGTIAVLDSNNANNNNNNTNFPCTRTGENSGSPASSASPSPSYRNSRSTSGAGLCGLLNLGNTCFMNSALQCMSNTPPLTEYFLSDRYLADLNRDNPLGMHGEIAIAYAEMIKALWSGYSQRFAPRVFKEKVGRFAPQFHGYTQQDCQELMAFLLDGLHEDLNRVKKKPYIEAKSADGRADRVVAKEAWDNYLKRNDSIVTDMFHGLLKSTLVCPDCKHVSVTFDPSCYLSLPLPLKKEKAVNAVVFRDKPSPPFRLRVFVPVYPTKCSGSDFYNIVAKTIELPAENLVAAIIDSYDRRVKRLIEPKDEEIDDVMEMVHVYELPTSPWKTREGSLIRVYMREVVGQPIAGVAFPMGTRFGMPFYLHVPTQRIATSELYDMALAWLQGRYVKADNRKDSGAMSDDEEPMDDECAAASGEQTTVTTEGRKAQQPGHVTIKDGLVMDATDVPTMTAAAAAAAAVPTKKRKLFTVYLVNEMCNTHLTSRSSNGELRQQQPEAASGPRVNDEPTPASDGDDEDDPVLELTERAYVALDWQPKCKKAFYDSSVHPVPSNYATTSSNVTKRPVKLLECLKLFTTTEKLSTDDLWYCPACKKHQQATKKFDLWSLPQVLIIHLKRFSYNRFFRDKIDTLVNFPINGLKLRNFVLDPRSKSATYDLISVANHYGGMGGGHYTAYAKNKLTGTWHHFDDASVTPISEFNIVSKNAYVLFYMRRDAPSNEGRSRSNGIDSASGGSASSTPNSNRAQRRLATQRSSSTSESEESESNEMDYC